MSDRLGDKQIDDLDRLELTATPGPWRAADCVVRGWDQAIGLPLGEFTAYQNADLTVAARNALRPLLDEVREARKRIADLEAELEKERDVSADRDHATLMQLDPVAAQSTDLYTYAAGKKAECERQRKRIAELEAQVERIQTDREAWAPGSTTSPCSSATPQSDEAKEVSDE